MQLATTRESLLVGYTDGKPCLQMVDVDAGRVTSLATPLDGRDYAVDHAYARDGYAVLLSGEHIAISVPSDLQTGAARLGPAWSVVPAVDPALVWLWQPERDTDGSVEYGGPSTCLLVNGAGDELDRVLLPPGLRLSGDTSCGMVVWREEGMCLWDRVSASPGRIRPGRDVVVHEDGLILLRAHDGLRVWDLSSDKVRSMEIPPGIDSPMFAESAPRSTLVAWRSGGWTRGADVHVVIADLATAMVVAVIPVDLPDLGTLCWSHDARWLYAGFWDASMIRCFSADGAVIEEVRFPGRIGNLLCDLGPAWVPPASKRIVVDYSGTVAGRLPRTSSEKSLRSAVGAVLRDELGRSVAKSVLNLTRPAVRLAPDETGRSRIGGDPVLPSGTAWPTRDGLPLSLLAHVDLAEVRRAWRTSPFPPTGSLEFFFGPLAVDEALGDHAAVLHVDGSIEDDGEARPSVEFSPVAVRPELVLTLPTDLEEIVGEDSASAVRDLFAELFGATGAWHQLGGHPGWIQGGTTGTLLLQVDADSEAGMEWGDGGRVYFLLDESALERADFAEAKAIEESY